MKGCVIIFLFLVFNISYSQENIKYNIDIENRIRMNKITVKIFRNTTDIKILYRVDSTDLKAIERDHQKLKKLLEALENREDDEELWNKKVEAIFENYKRHRSDSLSLSIFHCHKCRTGFISLKN